MKLINETKFLSVYIRDMEYHIETILKLFCLYQR